MGGCEALRSLAGSGGFLTVRRSKCQEDCRPSRHRGMGDSSPLQPLGGGRETADPKIQGQRQPSVRRKGAGLRRSCVPIVRCGARSGSSVSGATLELGRRFPGVVSATPSDGGSTLVSTGPGVVYDDSRSSYPLHIVALAAFGCKPRASVCPGFVGMPASIVRTSPDNLPSTRCPRT